MTEMKDDLLNWTLLQGSSLGFKDIESLQPLREQASLRHYFRIQTDTGTKIGVISEPCLLYTSPSPRDRTRSRMPSSA